MKFGGGVAERDRKTFKKVSNDIATFAGYIREAEENVGPVIQGMADLKEFIQKTAALRKAEPKDDLLSALVAAED